MKIKKGDTVIVRTGSAKGQSGEVTKVLPDMGHVVVKGVNIRTKHVKPSSKRQTGGLEKTERPIDISNVTLVHPTKKQKGSRVGFAFNKNGDKVRVFRQAGNREVK